MSDPTYRCTLCDKDWKGCKCKDLPILDNEAYNKPCPYNSTIMCVQMPCDVGDDNYCDDGCPNRKDTR